ncbi:hypothetical protein JCM6882_002355 [Rhodosporidiobolus microsporus]
MARTSQRKSAAQAKRALAKGEEEMDDGEYDPRSEEAKGDSEDGGEYVKPTKKKARSSGGGSSGGGGGGKKKGSKGSLSIALTSLPLELLASICAHLDLATVFHLSRLNKRFYGFLRAPAMRYVWENAREESGLPGLTAPGMDEVGLANLLFGCCKGCGKATAKVDYILRIRSCKACSPDLSLNQGIMSRNHYEYLTADLSRITRLLVNYESYRAPASDADSSDDDDDDARESYAGYTALRTRADFEGFDAACGTIRDQRQADGEALIDWVREREKQKADKLEDARTKRRDIIEARLAERGWQAHHFDNPDFQTHKHVNKAQPLSEAAWPHLRDELEELLRDAESVANAAFLADKSSERRTAVENQYATLCYDAAAAKACGLFPLPSWEEAQDLSSFKALWTLESVEDAYAEAPSLDDPSDEMKEELKALRTSFKMDVFERVVEAIKQVAAEQQQQQQASSSTATTSTSNGGASSSSTNSSTSLSSVLPTPEDDDAYSPQQIASLLSTAVSAIQCDACDLVDIFARQITHKCERHGSPDLNKSRPSFRASSYAIGPNLVRSALKLVKAAGKPVDVSAKKMDAVGRGFSCLNEGCSDAGIGLSWVAQLKHTTSSWVHRAYGAGGGFVAETRAELCERLYQMHVEKDDSEDKRGEVFEV